MKSIKENLSKLTESSKLIKIIIICGILGILLIALSGLTDTDTKKSEIVNYPVQEYKNLMQEELREMLFKIDGVGNVEVLLTIENSVEGVYLENNSTKTMEIEPKIRGVVVACQGGDEPLVTERVLNTVTRALNISSAKVCVTKLKE